MFSRRDRAPPSQNLRHRQSGHHLPHERAFGGNCLDLSKNFVHACLSVNTGAGLMCVSRYILCWRKVQRKPGLCLCSCRRCACSCTGTLGAATGWKVSGATVLRRFWSSSPARPMSGRLLFALLMSSSSQDVMLCSKSSQNTKLVSKFGVSIDKYKIHNDTEIICSS